MHERGLTIRPTESKPSWSGNLETHWLITRKFTKTDLIYDILFTIYISENLKILKNNSTNSVSIANNKQNDELLASSYETGDNIVTGR